MDNDIREVIGNVIVLHERQSYYVFTGQLSSFLFCKEQSCIMYLWCIFITFHWLMIYFKIKHAETLYTLPWHSSKYFKHCHQLSTWRYTRMARPSMLRSATWTPAEKNERNQIVEYSSFWMTGNLQSPFS